MSALPQVNKIQVESKVEKPGEHLNIIEKQHKQIQTNLLIESEIKLERLNSMFYETKADPDKNFRKLLFGRPIAIMNESGKLVPLGRLPPINKTLHRSSSVNEENKNNNQNI